MSQPRASNLQRRISTFFGPKGVAPPAKRQKPSSSAPPPPVVDVGARIAAARAAAAASSSGSSTTPALATPAFASLGPSWRAALAATLTEPFMEQLARFVARRRDEAVVFPPREALFSAFNACSLPRVRVVILGQDPYHGRGQAHGMAFSVKRGVGVPPSLGNMFKELEGDVDGFKRPRHGCLEAWAKQGVLLLNSVLTVEEGQANAHKGRGWERFSDAVIDAVDKQDGVVFMLWGNAAKSKAKNVDTKKHLVLTSVHPSPLSANRGGWFGSKHFSKANAWLVGKGLEPIDWSLPME